MLDFIEECQPEAWIYGHSHSNTPEFKIGKTRMLTNQLGYVEMGEYKTFKFNAFIEFSKDGKQ
jgi:Icc-related predicted phosphoesterase